MKAPNYINWHKGYSVGIELLDNQHKVMFDIINNIYIDIRNGIHDVNTRRLLIKLDKYAQQHFSDEEKLMHQSNYPDVIPHMKMHKAYSKKVADLIDQLNDTAIDTKFKTLEFLKKWWKNHIKNTDQSYTPYIKDII